MSCPHPQRVSFLVGLSASSPQFILYANVIHISPIYFSSMSPTWFKKPWFILLMSSSNFLTGPNLPSTTLYQPAKSSSCPVLPLTPAQSLPSMALLMLTLSHPDASPFSLSNRIYPSFKVQFKFQLQHWCQHWKFQAIMISSFLSNSCLTHISYDI